MLSWFFKKGEQAQPRSAPAVPKAPGAAVVATADAVSAPAAAGTDWAAQVQAAHGDDAALLRIASKAPVLAVKMAAVEALSSEGALRQAEREFRSHDRKVHRLAKQRLEAAVAQRETRARAQTLLERAAALADDADLPINHLVDLDRAWEALVADLLEPQQRTQFAALRTSLDATVRERGEAQQRLHRWLGEARRLLPEWQRAIAAAAAQGTASDIAAIGQQVSALMNSRPGAATKASADLDAALAQALQAATGVELRLAWLEAQEVNDAGPAVGADEPAGEAREEAAGEAPEEPAGEALEELPPTEEVQGGARLPEPGEPPTDESPLPMAVAETEPQAAVAPTQSSTAPPRWADLPALTVPELAAALEQRHTQWLRAHASAQASAQATAQKSAPDDAGDKGARRPAAALPPTPTPAKHPPRPGRKETLEAPQRLQAESLVQQAEQALAEGQLGAMQQQLQAIEAMLGHDAARVWPADLRARHQALRAEGARLKGWQHWGGARAREDLIAEAEALAGQTQAATDPEASTKQKLKLSHQAQSIQALRQRWKELDRLGAAASQALWQRFDEALNVAHAPVAAQHAALKAARQENLAARQILLAGLDALALPMDGAAPAETAAVSPADAVPLQWREVAHELHGFQLAWRKLGPIEHTVPASARQPLQQRLQESLERIERPLQAVRRAAAAEREQLIAQARSLGPGPDQALSWPEAARQVRELQAAWQQHARQLPLPRALETDLWTRFKAATDAVFAQRDAVAAAREAELAADLSVREALLERLAALDAATPLAQFERTVSEIEREWRTAAELPRSASDALEARFRTLRAAASQWMSDAQTRHWQDQCDALAAALTLCEEREVADGGGAELDPHWPGPGTLLPAWQQALALRWQRPVAPGPLSGTEVEDLLLQLEAALNLPMTAEREAARRMLKLRALKDTMEGRATPSQGPLQHADRWLAVLRQSGLGAAQRQRLRALMAALRQAPPGTLVQVGATARSTGF